MSRANRLNCGRARTLAKRRTETSAQPCYGSLDQPRHALSWSMPRPRWSTDLSPFGCMSILATSDSAGSRQRTKVVCSDWVRSVSWPVLPKRFNPWLFSLLRSLQPPPSEAGVQAFTAGMFSRFVCRYSSPSPSMASQKMSLDGLGPKAGWAIIRPGSATEYLSIWVLPFPRRNGMGFFSIRPHNFDHGGRDHPLGALA